MVVSVRVNGDFSIYSGDGSVQWDELGSTSNVNFGKTIPSEFPILRTLVSIGMR